MAKKKLFRTIHKGSLEKLENFFDKKLVKAFHININGIDEKGNTALLIAAKKYLPNLYHDDAKIIEKLISEGAKLDIANKAGMTPLMYAASNGNYRIVAKCIEGDTDFDCTKYSNKKALFLALEKNHQNVVQLLQKNGVNLDFHFLQSELIKGNSSSDELKALLIYSIVKGSSLIANKLIDAGADYLENTGSGKSPLFYAIEKENIELVKRMIRDKPFQNATDSNGRTALMYAAQSGNNEMLINILQAGADISARDKSGKTAFMYSASNGNVDVMKLLLANGALLNDNDFSGKTPLMLACGHGNTEAVEYLVSAGASVNVLDQKGRNALIHSLDSGDKKQEIVSALLKNKETKYVKEAMHLLDPESFFKFGHIAMMLINNSGDGTLYSFTFEKPYLKQKRDKSKKLFIPKKHTIKNKIDKFLTKCTNNDLNTLIGKTSLAAQIVVNKSLNGKLKRIDVTPNHINNLKYQNSESLDFMAKAQPSDRSIYKYTKRTLMKIDRSTPVEAAICGAYMQKMAEDILRSPGRYRLFTKNCSTISRRILKEGGIEVPKSLIPEKVYAEETAIANINRNWSSLNNNASKHSLNFDL